MEYKEHEIPERLSFANHQVIENKLDTDTFLATAEDLERYRRMLETKKTDLCCRACTMDGVRVTGIFLEVNCYDSCPEGDYNEYEPAKVEIGFAWYETESDTAAADRIKKTKKEIDRLVERQEKEILMHEVRQATSKEKKLEEAKRLLEEAGYKITKTT